jgi:MFS family permease
MSARERQGWIVVAAIFVAMFLIWGAINSGAVFFVPMLKYFGWSRARLAVLGSVGALSAGVSGPLVGWICDRADARKVMAAGAALIAVAYLAMSRSNTFGELLAMNALVGVGVISSMGIPIFMVIANWFREQRGLALGIANAGAYLGGAAMAPLVNHAISLGGWRAGYVLVGIPILVVAAPLIFVIVRARPAADTAAAASTSGAPMPAPFVLPGLDVGEALRARSLWLLSAALLLGSATATGIGVHIVAYLIGIGYSPAQSAQALSAIFIATTIGSVASGRLADRLNARRALVLVQGIWMLAIVALLSARHAPALWTYVVLGGAVGGAAPVLFPMLTVECFGLKRYGTLTGLTAIFNTIGFAIGPIFSGRIFDVTGSYRSAFWTFVAMAMVSGIAILGCRRMASEAAPDALAAASAG